jgi:hypothetical protein
MGIVNIAEFLSSQFSAEYNYSKVKPRKILLYASRQMHQHRMFYFHFSMPLSTAAVTAVTAEAEDKEDQSDGKGGKLSPLGKR